MLARFVSADTVVPNSTSPQLLNRYSYVNNNPLRYTDPSGHCIFGIDTIVCIALAGALLIGATSYVAIDSASRYARTHPTNWCDYTHCAIGDSQSANTPASSDTGGQTADPGGIDPNDPDSGPGSDSHKAQRWTQYQARGGKLSYEQWSRMYEANMVRARQANAAVNAYHKQLGWGRRELEVEVEKGVMRRLDIGDKLAKRGIEFKTGYQTASQENLSELARDQTLIRQGWDIKWVFQGSASNPLLSALKEARISYEFITAP